MTDFSLEIRWVIRCFWNCIHPGSLSHFELVDSLGLNKNRKDNLKPVGNHRRNWFEVDFTHTKQQNNRWKEDKTPTPRLKFNAVKLGVLEKTENFHVFSLHHIWNIYVKHIEAFRPFDVSQSRSEKYWLKIRLGSSDTFQANTKRCARSVVWTRRGVCWEKKHIKFFGGFGVCTRKIQIEAL